MPLTVVAQQKTSRPIYIAELLALIFSFLEDKSVARAARVCRLWSDVALDTLWHTIHDLRPLLNLLAPLTNEKRPVGRLSQYTFIVSVVFRLFAGNFFAHLERTYHSTEIQTPAARP